MGERVKWKRLTVQQFLGGRETLFKVEGSLVIDGETFPITQSSEVNSFFGVPDTILGILRERDLLMGGEEFQHTICCEPRTQLIRGARVTVRIKQKGGWKNTICAATIEADDPIQAYFTAIAAVVEMFLEIREKR